MPDWATDLGGIGALLLGALIVTWVTRWLLRRLERRMRGTLPADSGAAKRAGTLTSVIGAGAVVLIWAIALIMGLETLGVPVGPLIAAAGIGGVAIGFGAQNLVRDIVAGLFILSESQYDVGDHVRVGGVEGTVEAITLRSTVLRGLDGARHVVSNGEIRVSTNNTRLYSRYVMSVPVTYEADLDRAIEVLRGVGDGLADDPAFAPDLAGPASVLGVDAFTDSRVELKLFIETTPGRQWAIGRELRRRIRVALDAEGIPMAPAGGADAEGQEG